MLTVKFLKVFRGFVEYNHPNEVENLISAEVIEASSFPHTEHNLQIIAVIGLPPQFHGQLSGRIAWTHVEFETPYARTTNDKTWMVINYKLPNVVFPKPGKYPVEILVNKKVIHFHNLIVKKPS